MILGIGLTTTLVPQDIVYLGFDLEHLQALHEGLVQIVAKDRLTFGALLLAAGCAVLPTIWCGLHPGARELLLTLGIAMVLEVSLAVGVHPVIGYNDLVHLAPFLAQGIAFTAGTVLLWVPLDDRSDASRFPDLWVDAGPPTPEVSWPPPAQPQS